MNQRGKKLFGIGAKQTRLPSSVIIWLLFGALFGGFGLYLGYVIGEAQWFALILGASSLLMAFILYRRAKEIGLQY